MTRHTDVFLRIARGCVYALLVLMPLFFLQTSIEVLETNKQALLIVLAVASGLAWIASMVKRRAVELQNSWVHGVPVLLFAGVMLSSAFSIAPYRSWIGTSMQEYASVLTLFALVVLFYVSANIFSDDQDVKGIWLSLLLGANVTALIGLLSLFGIDSVRSFMPAGAQTTVGTANALGLYLCATAILANGLWMLPSRLHEKRPGLFEQAGTLLLTALTLVVLLLLDYWVLWIVFGIGLALLYGYAFFRYKRFADLTRALVGIICFLLIIPFLFFFDSPFSLKPPQDVTPSVQETWKVTRASWSETSYLFGSGPGTFQFDFAKHHSAELNATPYWDTRFDRGFSFLTTSLPTIGFIGSALLLLFVLGIFLTGIRLIATTKERRAFEQVFVVFVPWMSLVIGLLLYNANMTLITLFFFFSALVASRARHEVYKRAFSSSPRMALAASSALFVTGILLLSILFANGQRFAADVAFARAVKADRAGAPTNEVVAQLDRAASLNRFNDVYFRNLAQTYLLAVNDQLAAMESSEDATDDDRTLIQALTAASVNAVKRATDLSPYNTTNWLVRGSIYREYTPLIPKASDFALEAYEKAVELEPLNPRIHTELGKMHLAIAETYRQLSLAEDKNVQADAGRQMSNHLAKAEQSLQKAIELKPDYAPAQFHLALALEQKGQVDAAVEKMEDVVLHNSLDAGAVFQLGLLYMRRQGNGDATQAQKAFEHVIALVPTHANARWFLATILEGQGNVQGAIEQIEYLVRLDPNNALIKARLERLKSGRAGELEGPIESAP